MSVRDSQALQEWIDAVQEQATELRTTLDQARRETSEQVRARIAQFRADTAAQRNSARDKARQTVGQAQSQWQSMRADAATRMRNIHDHIDSKRDEMDVKKAERHAEHAETDAEEALDFAWWAVGEAQLSVLDALDARAWADERAAASRSN